MRDSNLGRTSKPPYYLGSFNFLSFITCYQIEIPLSILVSTSHYQSKSCHAETKSDKTLARGLTDTLAVSIKMAAKQSSSQDICNTMKILPIQQRLPEFRDGKIVKLATVRKLEAAYVQMHGKASREQCTKCQCGKGPFQECVFAETGEEKEIMGGSCVNCYYYEDGYSESQCSLRKPSQSKCESCFPVKMNTKIYSAYRSKKADSAPRLLLRGQRRVEIIRYASLFRPVA